MATTTAPPDIAKCSKEAAKESFKSVYQQLRDEILQDPLVAQEDTRAWMAKMMDYNVPGGKLNRGLAVKDTLLAADPAASMELQFKADAIGWAIELLQAYFLVADDIMDNSITRRGQPCWYRAEGVGMVAINDGIILEQLIYVVLKRHVKGHACYPDVVDLFLDVTRKTAHGQLLDLITAPIGKVDLEKYKMTRYMDIVTYKTAYYSFYLPVACGLMLAGTTEHAGFEVAEQILVKMGQYFQIQDDYLDCFADPETLGKIGTDIQDNKCSWLVCKALEQATPEQRSLIAEHYGRDDPDCIARIKEVYREMQLEEQFKAFEQESYIEIQQMIRAQTAVPAAVFELFLAKIYKRQK